MEDLGLWLMYDMRFDYTNTSSLLAQVNSIKSRKNLLLWYTADEPDGSSDAQNATRIDYEATNAADGYHPVSLVLNCADYDWTEYSSGADIILQDVYPLYDNMTYSSLYDTVCNTTYGCCSCDNCEGNLNDISTRIDNFYDRIHLTNRDLNATVWSTFQSFVGDFSGAYPSGAAYLAMAVLAINHGTAGIVSWEAPTTNSIMAATTTSPPPSPR